MSFLDALDGSAYSRANRNNQQAVAIGLQQGGGALQDSASNALKYLLGAPGQAGGLQIQDRAFDQATGALTDAYGRTTNTLSALGALYEPEAQQGKGAVDRYMNAIGANGTAGSAQAAQDFTASPGYKYGLDQALGAVQRTAASRGMLGSGNTTQDVLSTANGIASQGFQNYINNLKGGTDFYSQGIAGQAGALQGQAQASQAYGNGLSALDTGRGSALAGTLGAAAGVQQQLGQGIAGLTNQATNTLAQSNLYSAKGQTDASSNALGALFGGANLLAGGAGSAGGLGALQRGLGNVFSSAVGFNPIPRF